MPCDQQVSWFPPACGVTSPPAYYCEPTCSNGRDICSTQLPCARLAFHRCCTGLGNAWLKVCLFSPRQGSDVSKIDVMAPRQVRRLPFVATI